jgi:hypothetical protein
MKLGLRAIWVSVSSMSSFVSPGTGGSRLIGLGVDAAGVATSAGVAAPLGWLSGFAADSPTLAAGEAGRDAALKRCSGSGEGVGGVRRSIRYERKSSSWSLR